MEFVFIVGIARTGSKIYMNNINQFSDIDIVDEMHYLAPRYIRKDAVTALGLNKQSLTTPCRVSRALNQMYSGVPKGTFWEAGEGRGKVEHRLTDIDKGQLRCSLEAGDGTPESVFRTLLIEHAQSVDKSRPGAKYPVDIGRVPTLQDWFPDAKFLHIIRDPRAIYSSMVKREIKNPDLSSWKQAPTRLRRLLYVVLQFRRAARLHRRFAGSSRYFLSRFEDVVSDPEKGLSRVCAFLSIDYRPEMLMVRKVDSSFAGNKQVGIDKATLNQWQSNISPLEHNAINVMLRSELSLFGYQ